MRFTKMEGIGNDYIFFNCLEEQVRDPSELARDICARHFGVGADGIILIEPSETTDVRMRIFNADGSEAEMCGNGIRCLGKYVYDNDLCRKEVIQVETAAGLRTVNLVFDEAGRVKAATVDMGRPALRREEIPMEGDPGARVIDEPLKIEDHEFRITCLSLGNPHCIIPVTNIDWVPWQDVGARIESHELFPRRANVHFVEVVSRDEIMVTSWERGAGPTLACGTGASAACVAMNLVEKTERKITAHLPGGDLDLEWADDDHVYMTGPAEKVFTGEWER